MYLALTPVLLPTSLYFFEIKARVTSPFERPTLRPEVGKLEMVNNISIVQDDKCELQIKRLSYILHVCKWITNIKLPQHEIMSDKTSTEA